MATMGRYCKAYTVQHLQEFPGWPQDLPAQAGVSEEEQYYFLQENLSVTRDIFLEDVVFTGESDEWRRFCHETLAFAVPADIPDAPGAAAGDSSPVQDAEASVASAADGAR